MRPGFLEGMGATERWAQSFTHSMRFFLRCWIPSASERVKILKKIKFTAFTDGRFCTDSRFFIRHPHGLTRKEVQDKYSAAVTKARVYGAFAITWQTRPARQSSSLSG